MKLYTLVSSFHQRSQVSVVCVVRTQSACSTSPAKNLHVSVARITMVMDLIALRWIAVPSKYVILMQTACTTHSNYDISVCVEMVSQVSSVTLATENT